MLKVVDFPQKSPEELRRSLAGAKAQIREQHERVYTLITAARQLLMNETGDEHPTVLKLLDMAEDEVDDCRLLDSLQCAVVVEEVSNG